MNNYATSDRVTTLENYFSTAEDSDATINKWHEIVAFLEGTNEGSTVESLLAAKANQSALNDTNTNLATVDAKFANYQLANTAINTSNISSQSVAYAANAGAVGGIGIYNGTEGIATISSAGVMEVGKYIDFHASGSTKDYSVRFQCSNDNGVSIHLPSASGTLALSSQIPTQLSQLTDNVGYATQSWVEGKGYITTSALNGYITESAVNNKLAAYQPLSTAINTGNIGSQSVNYATSAGTATSAPNYLPLGGGTLTGSLTVNSTIKASSVICGTTRLRVNASDNAGNFGYIKAETYSSNRGVLRIGTNYGGSETITNAGVDVDAINIYRGVVGIGGTIASDELYSKQGLGVSLFVSGSTQVTGQLAVSSTFSADGAAGVAGVFIRNEGGIELSHASTPYIDFHMKNTTEDFSNRLICDTLGRLQVQNNFRVTGTTWLQGAVTIDSATTVNSTVSASGGFFETSDERLKDFGNDIDIDFDALKSIPKKYFTWKDDEEKKSNIGTGAQTLQKYYPELVNENNGTLTVAYDKLSIVALKAVDMLHEENTELKDRLNKLERLVNDLAYGNRN